MKKFFFFGLICFGFTLLNSGCETVRTLDAPDDAYNIRKPADTTRAVKQEEGVLIERVY